MLDATDLSALAEADAEAWRRFLPSATALAQAAIRRVLTPAGRTDEVVDVVQDFFLRLLKDERRLLRRFDPERARLSTYLAIVASSCAVDHLRKGAPQPLGSAQDLEDMLPSTAAPSPTGDRLDIPAGVLTSRQTLILQLTYERDMTPQETGALLGITEQTVRSMRHKALTRLRGLANEDGDNNPSSQEG